ncbi:MAG: glycosyltransferase [Burkholderiales bacterium]|nr:glycosyltransferase [Burkholderiales bacterium]
MNVVNLSELDPAWNWLSGRAHPARPVHWAHASAKASPVPGWLPRATTLRRALAGWRSIGLLGDDPRSLLVSHGPRMTMYGAFAGRLRRRRPRHLAYSFNFTELPQGRMRRAMADAFASVDRFVCFSQMERELYARHFDLDPMRIDMIHWAARPPDVDPGAAPRIRGDYVCALGSQGRDYATLIAAMRTLPMIKLVIVATAESLAGLAIPGNVEVLIGVPLAQAMNVLQHSRFSVVPLRGAEVPCGHVTLVSAMHCAKATVVSDSSGVSDYVTQEVTGLAVPVADVPALAGAIERLWADAAAARALGDAAKAFATAHCGEDTVVAYLENYLNTHQLSIPGRGTPRATPKPTGDSR